MRLFEDISGVHGAIQGKAAQSGTPASLYAQQIQYSSTNLLDLFESFKTFREDRDIKIMKTIQQFYSDNRYLNLAGNNYGKEISTYTPEEVRNTEFDLSIAETLSTPALRMASNEFLMVRFVPGKYRSKCFCKTEPFLLPTNCCKLSIKVKPNRHNKTPHRKFRRSVYLSRNKDRIRLGFCL